MLRFVWIQRHKSSALLRKAGRLSRDQARHAARSRRTCLYKCSLTKKTPQLRDWAKMRVRCAIGCSTDHGGSAWSGNYPQRRYDNPDADWEIKMTRRLPAELCQMEA